MAFEELKQAAESIVSICDKEKHSKADKDKLHKLNEAILEAIEKLVECEGCNNIGNSIATITLSGVTAKLCKECGIRALEAGKIVMRKERARRTSKPKKSEKANAQTTPAEPKVEEVQPKPENPKPDVELYNEVEAQTGIKKSDVKRIDKLIKEIATPMGMENTVVYIAAELEQAKVKVERPAMEKAVSMLMQPAN